MSENTGRSLRCVCCNKILQNESESDLCYVCKRYVQNTYDNIDINDFKTYPLEFEKEEFSYIKKHSYIE